MIDVPLCCHRCWRRLADPYDAGPPYSSTFAASGGTVLLLFLCPPCRDRFPDDRAREQFLARVAGLAPLDPRTASHPGLHTLVWVLPTSRHLAAVTPAPQPGGRAARRQHGFVEIREAG